MKIKEVTDRGAMRLLLIALYKSPYLLTYVNHSVQIHLIAVAIS